MIRIASITIALLFALQSNLRADWKLDLFYEFTQKQTIELSKSPRSENIDRVRKALNDKLSKFKFRGTIRVLTEPNQEQAGVRIDAASFVMVVVAERGVLIYSEIVEK